MNNFVSVSRYCSAIVSVFALTLIVLTLVIPNRLSDISVSSFLVFPLELLLVGLLLLLPSRTGLVIRWMIAALLALGVIFKCADMATFKVFSRPFNPLFDGYLFANGMNLLNGAIGKAGALLVAVLLVLVVLAIVMGAFWVLGRVQRLLCVSVHRSATLLMGGLALWLGLYFVGSPRASIPFYQHLSAHARDILATAIDVKSFNVQLDKADAFVRVDENLFALLRGKDVLVIFVESYGRTVLDNPEFAPHIRPLLESSSGALAEKGFAARSGFLTSPTVGGLSWLAHGTAMSGLWIDNQIRYNNLMLSQRPTLNRLFRRAGWRTLAVMPAITMAWPEGNYYGYDKIYHAHNLGYQGLPFNWVTMPDQYTLAAFQQFERVQKARAPVMAEIALISSHAPWTPVPQMIDWNTVEDGRAFNVQASSGDSPEVVWKDKAHIRQQYRLSIAYALENIISYVTHYGDDNLVLLILGDHQPAPIVTGAVTTNEGHPQQGSRDVPVHLIARDQHVMSAIDHWQWTEGMVPSAAAPVWPMDKLRNRFIEAFSLPAD